MKTESALALNLGVRYAALLSIKNLLVTGADLTPFSISKDAKSLSKQERMLASFVAAGVLATFGVSSSFLRLPLPMPLTQLASSLAETRGLGLFDLEDTLEAAKEKLRSSVEALKPAPETAPCDAVGCFQENLEEVETAAERRARIAAWNAQLEAEAKVVPGLPAKVAPVSMTGAGRRQAGR
jgi:hypothetical protein